MRPYRPQRNRRNVDPIGVTPAIRGCFYRYTVDAIANARLVTAYATAPIATVPPANQFEDPTSGGTGTTITKIADNAVNVLMDTDCGADDLMEFNAEAVPTFGPNVVGVLCAARVDLV